MIKGIVADIQRASVHDGPGIRTTVFLKGCPLHCAWCHNPECIDYKPQTMYYPEKCIGCGLCEEGCFSGGEPLLQRDFLSALIDRCKEERIHCAIETSLIYFDAEILKKVDLVMADLKIWDNELHKKYTGVGNEKIKENFAQVNKLGIPIIARTPVIPEITQGIDCISEFLRELDNVEQYELLPYHPLGGAKREALGIETDGFSIPSAELMKELKKYVFIR